MRRLQLMVVLIGILVLVLGCGGGPDPKENTTEETTTENTTEETTTENTTEETTTENTTEETTEETASTENFEWMFVLETLGVDEISMGKLKPAVEEKWLKGKNFKEFSQEEYTSSMSKYEGKKVMYCKVTFSYGNYDFSLESSTVVKDGEDYFLDPLEGPGIPNHRIPRAEDVDRLIKEFKYLKEK